MLCAAFLGKRVVMTFHDQFVLSKYSDKAWLQRLAAAALIRHRSVRWIAVSPKVKEQLTRLRVPAARISVIPAYLRRPPGEAGPIGGEIRAFCASHHPVLLIYGWSRSLDDQGRDLYGFDRAVRSLAALRRVRTSAGLLVLVPQPRQGAGIREIETLAESLGVGAHVLFVKEPLEDLGSLWPYVDLLLRPTSTDGDSILVREALAEAIPVVASDSVPRPPGVATYAYGDTDALLRTQLDVLESREESDCVVPVDYFGEVLAVYVGL
jgi:hypothetical protein